MPDLTIVAFDADYQPPIRAIRDAVFIGEQNIDPGLEFDGLDGSAIHALVAVEGTYVGTGRMLDDGHIGRIAILRDYRGRGLGAKLVQHAGDIRGCTWGPSGRPSVSMPGWGSRPSARNLWRRGSPISPWKSH
ncbi:hypothetical protein GCM10022394_26090 [Zobellella aerophila]|uniref:N-acetyltransferase domain-containing protein n=1 Tax=Zobellella aerophila TaxID=870480 RepID=A0ABP6W2G2_9GAMM